jgi:hypothetical protein
MMGGLWGGIANLGLAGRGFEAEDAVIAENKRRESAQKLTDIAVKEAMRREGLEQGLRDAVSKVPMRAAASGLPMTTVTPPDESDRWGETQIATTPGMDLPASVDARGKAEAGARYLADQGELERAEKYRQAAKAMEDEGYKTVVVGVAAGKDPKAIAEEFNQVGKHRIVNAAANGGTYRFQLDDGTEMPVTQAGARNLATAMGYLKKPETKIVPQGATETVDGVPVYHNDPKPDHEKIDPLSPKGIAARKDFEEYKASMLGGKGAGSGTGAPAKIREVQQLMSDFGLSQDDAISLAYGIGKNSKNYEERVQKWITTLKGDMDLAQDNEKLIARARQLAKTFGDEEARSPTRPSVRPTSKAAAVPAQGAVIDAPSTQAELESLPSGTRVRDPETGRIFRVP